MASILLVEEDVALREQRYDLLTTHGFSVITAYSGEQAMEVLKHERPDLILANGQLSDIPACEFTDRIRAFDTNLPILLLGLVQETRQNSLTSNTQGFLARNISNDALVKEVRRRLKAPEPARPERWPGTILVVDDEVKMRTMLQEFLQLHGFVAVTAASGEEALQELERSRPSVILLDFKMPGMDGLVALKKIKAARSDVMVIMMTGFEEEGLLAKASALGATDYLMKPFDLNYIESTLLSRILLGKAP